MAERIALFPVLAALWLTFIPLAAPAAENGPSVLTLEQCIELSLGRNPLWLAAEEDYQASLARVRQARELPQPSLEFDSDLQPRPLSFRRADESYFGVSQTVEFPGRRSLRGRIASSESREFLADKNLLRLELVFQVKEAFYSILLAAEKHRYAALDLELARDFLGKAEVKFEAGDIARVEVLRAGVEVSKAATEAKLAESDILLAKARLNYLLGRSRFEPIEVAGELARDPMPHDLEALVRKAIRSRPEVERAAARLDKERGEKTEAAMSYLPDFDLGLARHRLTGEPTTWNFTLSFPIPLFFWQPARGRIAETRANIRSLERQAEDLRNLITLEVEQGFLSAASAESRIALFEKEILAQAEDVYNLILFSFEEGEIGGLELIEARRTLVEARKAYAEALYVYNMTLAALERSVGRSLEGGDND